MLTHIEKHWTVVFLMGSRSFSLLNKRVRELNRLTPLFLHEYSFLLVTPKCHYWAGMSNKAREIWVQQKGVSELVSNVVAQLEKFLKSVPEKLQDLPQEQFINPRSPGKWSRLQILGHLCDSAVNNLTRFIQAQHQPEPLAIVPYNQNVWVASQGYFDAPIDEVVTLWVSLNRSIVRVISSLPKEKYSYSCMTSNGDVVTLEWLIDDYLQHMEHHFQQIFPE